MARRPQVIEGDDGLLADVVKEQASDKHARLSSYVHASRGARKGFIRPGYAGATYFEPFCGSGRALLGGTDQWIEGSVVAAWKQSASHGAPFSRVFISDVDAEKLAACRERLERLSAPVTVLPSPANLATEAMVQTVDPRGLHVVFLDPYSLSQLEFAMIKMLADRLQRVDLLLHVSVMDLNRNFDKHTAEGKAFDTFAPGWRERVDMDGSQAAVRLRVVAYWRELIRELGLFPSSKDYLVRGRGKQPLYALVLASRHKLAHKLWDAVVNPAGQKSLF